MIGGPPPHPKAFEFARARDLPIEVEAIGSISPTRIGGTQSIAVTREPKKPLRIALAGFGVVGHALSRRLEGNESFEIAEILVGDLDRKREFEAPVRLTDDVGRFSKCEADVLVDLLSWERTAAVLSCAKLLDGIPVVTASKRMVSERFLELAANAAVGRARFACLAAVGGSSPASDAPQGRALIHSPGKYHAD